MSIKIAVNLLTLSRIVLGVLFAFFLLLPGCSLIAAFVFYALACATDILDGRFARCFGAVSPLGAVLDAVADVTLLLTAFSAMAAAHLLPWWIIAVALLKFGEFLVTSRILAGVHNGAATLFFDKLGRLSAILMLALPLFILPLYSLLPAIAEILVTSLSEAVCLMAAGSSIYRIKRCIGSRTKAMRLQKTSPNLSATDKL